MRAAILCMLLLAPFCAKAQKEPVREVRVTIGRGAYAQGDLKKIEELRRLSYNYLPLKTTDNFPSYFFFGGEFRWLLRRGSVGAIGQLESTGSKRVLSDYAGSLELTQKVRAVHLGAVGSFDCFKMKKIRVSVETQANLVLSNVDISSEWLLWISQPWLQKGQFTSMSFLLRPALDFSYQLHPSIVVHAIGGYAFDLRGSMELKTSSGFFPMPTLDSTPKTDWSGWRAGISVAYRF